MKIKRAISLFLIFIFSFVLISCNKTDDSKRMDVPKNGIIKSKVFEDLMFNQDMMMFDGQQDDISYQWLFMGGTISDPHDTNLLVDFNTDKNDDVKQKLQADFVYGLTFKEDKSIDWSPSLSITFNQELACDDVEIYKYDSDSDNYNPVVSGKVDSKDNGTITFTVTDNIGKFYVVGKNSEDISQNQNQSKESQTTENDSSSSSSSNYLTSGAGEGGGSSDNSSGGQGENKQKISNGSRTEQDQYQTDPVPAGKPEPIEPENVTVNKNNIKHCTLSIRCDTLLDKSNYETAKSNGKAGMIPSDGVIYSSKTVEFYDGEFVFDVLLREVQKYGIQMEYSMTPIYNSNYIEGIHNLYEFDGGELSGWMYKVNGWFPNYGCSRYLLQDGDVVEWVYTCDLGRDVGCDWLGDQ